MSNIIEFPLTEEMIEYHIFNRAYQAFEAQMEEWQRTAKWVDDNIEYLEQLQLDSEW